MKPTRASYDISCGINYRITIFCMLLVLIVVAAGMLIPTSAAVKVIRLPTEAAATIGATEAVGTPGGAGNMTAIPIVPTATSQIRTTNTSASSLVNTNVTNITPPQTTSPITPIPFEPVGGYVNPLLALETGPMVYVATTPALVIDSSTREVVSKIKVPDKGSRIDAIVASPDGKYVYLAESWAVYESDYYGGHYDQHSRIIRLNATTQDPIDYFQFDDIYPWHLDVSPDGRVYLGFQTYGYPNKAGIRIMNFQTGEWWYLDYDQAMIINNFEFSPDGSKVYYSAWWQATRAYMLDWTVNKVYNYVLPGNSSNYYEYARSLALGVDGKMLYAAINDNKGIFAMNTQDNGKHVIATDYIPVTLALSPDEQSLYVIGYFMNSNDEPVYLIHKYGGLKVVGPYFGSVPDYSLSAGSTFYTTDSLSYITQPPGYYPSRMVVANDGRFAYIVTAKADGVSDAHGGGPVIVYDLQYMNQLPNIDAKAAGYDISAAAEKIVHAPTPDYILLSQLAIDTPKFGTNTMMVKEFYPKNGSFAKYYKEDFFEVYVIFTSKLDNKTVNSSTFWVTKRGDDTPLAGHTTAASNIAMLVLAEQLAPGTDYVAHLSKEISSTDGKPLYADVVWEFNTKNISGQMQAMPTIDTALNLSKTKQVTPVLRGKLQLINNTNETDTTETQPQQQAPAQTPEQPPQPEAHASGQTETAPTPVLQPQEAVVDNGDSDNGNGSSGGASSQTTATPSTTQQAEQNLTGQADAEGQETKQQQVGEMENPKERVELNPQPEPPKPAGNGIIEGMVDAIANFFKGLLGWK